MVAFRSTSELPCNAVTCSAIIKEKISPAFTFLESNLATQRRKICKLSRKRGRRNHGNRPVFSSGELIHTDGFHTGHTVTVTPLSVGFLGSSVTCSGDTARFPVKALNATWTRENVSGM